VFYLLETVKTALRIPSDPNLESEAQDLITAAKSDLQLAGVLQTKIVDNDPLIKRAIVTYCKANFGWDNPEAERFQKSYESLKNHLSLSVEYTVAST
jgi:uncharacterized phage protein (predicted DNA packaging)